MHTKDPRPEACLAKSRHRTVEQPLGNIDEVETASYSDHVVEGEREEDGLALG